MATFKDKISHLINSQVPDYVLEDHPLFLDFVKLYYQFLESAEITLKEITDPDHLQLDSAVGATDYLLLSGTNSNKDDQDDRILLESTQVGDFINNEIITGSTSGATSTILVEDVDANSRLFVSHQNKFIEGEVITGNLSNATATISKYRANPVQNIQQLLDYADTDKTIQGFLIKFRNAFLTSVPENLHSQVDKRKLIKNVKSLYQAKGTKRASEIFFKLLFNEPAEIRYPKENMLRVSDGKWETRTILRCLETGNSDTSNLIGQTITQAASNVVGKATAVVEDVFKFIIGSTTVIELVLGLNSISGTFVAGENITGVDNTNDEDIITASITGIISGQTITNDGALYNTSDTISLTAGGTGASLQVKDIGPGALEEILVDTGGSGYEIGDVVNFNSGTATAKVSVVNGGVTLESATGTGQLILEDDTMSGDPYDGNKVVQESGTGSKDITDVRIINPGNSYISVPTVSVTSTSGASAKLLAYGSQIGRVLNLKVIDHGFNYQASPSPTIKLPTYLLVTNISGSFLQGNTITDGTITATIESLDSNTNILKVKDASGTYSANASITASNGATATILRIEQSTATLSTAAVVTTDGEFINEDGWASEDTMKVQDSLLYQDYSYIIKVGRSINEWKDSYIKTLHASGFYFRGEINIENRVSAQISNVTGVNTGTTAILKTMLSTIFSVIVGRRLGTESDGTSLRANAKLGVAADIDTSTGSQFSSSTRDITLKSPTFGINYVSRLRRTIGTTFVKQGFAYAGLTYGTLNKRFNTSYGGTNNFTANSKVTIERINELKIKGTNTSLDNTNSIFLLTSSNEGRKIKTNFAFPATISKPSGTFDNTTGKFSSTQITFDTSNAL
tara:strand:+ start:3308 stop:5881 length:2574 start_codon:yes stop_codon:yes gene_type:complete